MQLKLLDNLLKIMGHRIFQIDKLSNKKNISNKNFKINLQEA